MSHQGQLLLLTKGGQGEEEANPTGKYSQGEGTGPSFWVLPGLERSLSGVSSRRGVQNVPFWPRFVELF